MPRRLRNNPLLFVYLLSFFFTLHVAVPVYIESSFLGTLVSEKSVGIIFALAYGLSAIALFVIPRVLRVLGDFRVTLLLLAAETAVYFGLGFLRDPLLLIILFIVSFALIYLISFDLDLIVESFSKNANTGSVRGLYLTSSNIALVLAPTLAAGILTDGDYWRVFVAAAVFLIPALVIFARKFTGFKDPPYRVVPLLGTLRRVLRSRDLRASFLVSFLLQFFFTAMVIYTPLYLHMNLGFAWGDIGLIFSIMLVPFLILEAPLGRLADRVLGEKEMLILGFVITAGATALISFTTDTSFLTWAALLFMTRVGASMIEIMDETYFFKKVDGKDADIVSFKRAIRPLAGAVAPLAATAILGIVAFKYLFLVLGLVMLLGLVPSSSIRDTR